MLHETFRDQVRATQSAPVQLEGGGIGMVNCDREVLVGVRTFLFFQPVSSLTSVIPGV